MINRIRSIFSNNLKIVTIAIVLIGISIRLLVVANTEDITQGACSSIIKVHLNYEWARKELINEAGVWQNGQYLYDCLYNLKENNLDVAELYRQLELSNHPPLYYILLHTLSVTTNGFTHLLVSGMLFNVFLSVFVLLLFYYLCFDIFGSKELANFGLALLSFSLITMFSLVLLKGYILQTIFILSQFYLIIKNLDNEKIGSLDFLLFFLVCLGGFLTHYFSFVFSAFICLIVSFHYSLVTKNIKRLLTYAFLVISSIVTAIFIYPKMIHDVLYNSRSKQIQDKFDPSIIWFGVVAFVIVVFVVWFVNKRFKEFNSIQIKRTKFLYVLFFSMASSFFILTLSPGNPVRYFTPIVPILMVLMVFMFDLFVKRGSWLMGIAVTILIFSCIQLGLVFTNLLKSEFAIPRWHSTSMGTLISKKEPILIVTNKIGERIRPILYFSSSREVAISLDGINKDLLLKQDDAVILLEKGLEKIVDKKEALRKLNYTVVGEAGRYLVYIKGD